MWAPWLPIVTLTLLYACFLIAGSPGTAAAEATDAGADPRASGRHAPPDPDEIERQGAIIGSIRFRIVNVFDTSLEAEDRVAFRLVNRLHIRSREETIRRQLLFAEGEPFVKSRLAETERNLRALPFIQEAGVEAESYENGLVDVLVTTRDDWSTGASVRFGVSGGKSTSGLSLSEINFLGRGKQLQFSVRNGLDRTTQDLKYDDRNLLGTRLHLGVGHRQATDGSGNELRFERPFYSLETQRAYGIDALKSTDRFSFYQEGDVLQRFDHESEDIAAWYGWSEGLRDGVVVRWWAGYEFRNDAYEFSENPDPGYPPEDVPATRRVSAPTIEYAWIHSDYIKVKNFERFSRFEDFNLGSSIDLRLNLASKELGSTNNEVLYTFTGSRGFRTWSSGVLLANASVNGRAGAGEEGLLHVDAAHYYTGWPRQTFVVRLSGDAGIHLDASEQLRLGGETGLRGYGTRRFDGDRRFLLNVEDRLRSNRQWLRLAQFGAAVFTDVGNAWGGLRSTEICSRQRSSARRRSGAAGQDAVETRVCRIVVEDNSFGNLKADVGIALLADVVRAANTRFVRLSVAYPLNGEKYDQATVLLSVGKEGGF